MQDNLRPSRSCSTGIERFTDSGEDRTGVPGGDQVSPAPVNDHRQAGQTKRKLESYIALVHRVQPGTVLQRRSRDLSYPTNGIEF